MLGLRRSVKERDGASQTHQAVTRDLEAALERYRHRDRLEILNPFRALFDATCRADGEIGTSKLQQSVLNRVDISMVIICVFADCALMDVAEGCTGRIFTSHI